MDRQKCIAMLANLWAMAGIATAGATASAKPAVARTLPAAHKPTQGQQGFGPRALSRIDHTRGGLATTGPVEGVERGDGA